jgi:hypothetical protein
MTASFIIFKINSNPFIRFYVTKIAEKISLYKRRISLSVTIKNCLYLEEKRICLFWYKRIDFQGKLLPPSSTQMKWSTLVTDATGPSDTSFWKCGAEKYRRVSINYILQQFKTPTSKRTIGYQHRKDYTRYGHWNFHWVKSLLLPNPATVYS